jgi:hypothetical protein
VVYGMNQEVPRRRKTVTRSRPLDRFAFNFRPLSTRFANDSGNWLTLEEDSVTELRSTPDEYEGLIAMACLHTWLPLPDKGDLPLVAPHVTDTGKCRTGRFQEIFTCCCFRKSLGRRFLRTSHMNARPSLCISKRQANCDGNKENSHIYPSCVQNSLQ